MNEIINNKFYMVFLVIYVFIVFTNYNNLKNPRPYPSKKIREEFKRAKFSFSAYKYKGFSHYNLRRLVKSESNWKNRYNYWNKSFIKIGVIGIIITIIVMIAGEFLNLYEPFIGVSIILLFLILAMILISYKIEKSILRD